jgi:hypothetical protein
MRDFTFTLPGCDLDLIPSLRLDDVADGLGLSQVHLTVHESPQGKLPRFGQARA